VDFTTLIDVESLRMLIGTPGTLVLDCRFDLGAPAAGREAYLRGHIPGARYLDLNRDLSAPVSATSGRHPLPDPRGLAALLAGLGLGPDTQAVVYDESNGSFAARAWWLLRWLGHSRVAVLDGGMGAWLHAQGALESGESARTAPGPSAGDARDPGALQVNRCAVIGTEELIAALDDPRTLLIDARAAERFAGTVEPIDPVAGHIPGAANHPFSANLRADGRFLPAEELERRWRDRLAGASPADAIVIACHNLLALERAGFAGAKLYAGSWSEWIRDPRRPVARG
jgi:thiosulfate/3-mercaptopyruvate sulfurtransferase